MCKYENIYSYYFVVGNIILRFENIKIPTYSSYARWIKLAFINTYIG